MRTIEIAGPVGTGKSSLVDPLKEALFARGLAISRLEDVAHLGRPQLVLWSIGFVLRRPLVAWRALAAAARAPIPLWHRRLILGLVLTLGGKLAAAGRAVGPEHWVIVDEGLVHRTVNLFAWNPTTPNQEIACYLASIPAPDVLLVVNASPEAALQRVARRGRPKRLARRSEAEVAAFMGRARDVILLAADVMEKRGTSVKRVDNRRSLRRAIAQATDAAMPQEKHRPSREDLVPPFTPRYPILPRPDRSVRRPLARRTSTLSRLAVVDVLSLYGLEPIGRPRAMSSPGGRGASMRVRTDGGEVVVKRYKPSASARQIAVEHSVLEELDRLRLPAPRLRRTATAQTWLELEAGTYAVFDYLAGLTHPHEQVLLPPDRRHFETLAGTVLADLHSALTHHQPPASDTLGFVSRTGTRVRPIEWYADRLAGAPVARRLRAWVEGALWRLWETLDSEELGRTIVHGDYGPYNMLIRPGARPVVIDWELSRMDWRIVDLATCLPRFAQRRLGFDARAALRLINAYRARSAIPFREVRQIPEMLAFLSLQRAVVAWGRAEDERDARWEDEARRLVLLAEDLLSEQHPLCSVVRT